MRVVLITQIPPAAQGLDQLLRELGHDPVAMLAARVTDVRYEEDAATHVLGAPAGLDVLIPAGRERIAPLLRGLAPDVALCAGFPWKIPADALTAPRLASESGSYFSFFEPDYVWIDWERPAEEIYRQVRAWRFGSSGGGEHGALTELDGERVRVLRVRLEPGAGRPVECGDGTIWILESEPVTPPAPSSA